MHKDGAVRCSGPMSHVLYDPLRPVTLSGLCKAHYDHYVPIYKYLSRPIHFIPTDVDVDEYILLHSVLES